MQRKAREHTNQKGRTHAKSPSRQENLNRGRKLGNTHLAMQERSSGFPVLNLGVFASLRESAFSGEIARYCAVQPPSIRRSVPVMKPASSEHR